MVVRSPPRRLGRGSLGRGNGIETKRVVRGGGTDRQRIFEIVTVVRAGRPPLHSHDGRWRFCRQRPCRVRLSWEVGGGVVEGGRSCWLERLRWEIGGRSEAVRDLTTQYGRIRKVYRTLAWPGAGLVRPSTQRLAWPCFPLAAGLRSLAAECTQRPSPCGDAAGYLTAIGWRVGMGGGTAPVIRF